jgi:hypothetical protein
MTWEGYSRNVSQNTKFDIYDFVAFMEG